MKKALLIIAITFAINLTHANISEVFTIDRQGIATQMEDLNTLEQFVTSNPDMTFSEIQTSQPMLTSNILKPEESPFSQLSILTSNKYTRGDDGCLWILACTCCISSSIGFVFYYLEYMASMM